jgi:hypothetical protein
MTSTDLVELAKWNKGNIHSIFKVPMAPLGASTSLNYFLANWHHDQRQAKTEIQSPCNKILPKYSKIIKEYI